MTFEDMLNEQSFNLKELAVGSRIEADVTEVRAKDVVFSHDEFFVGVLPVSEFSVTPSIGDKITVYISELDDGYGNVVYDHKDGMRNEVIHHLSSKIDDGDVVDALVVSVSRAGLNLIVDGYVDAFMPKKQVSIEYMEDFDHLVGTTIKAKILSFDELHENLILSHKALLRDEGDGALETLDYGVTYDCVVTGVAKFGLFVDVGGLTGLIHVTDLDWDLSKANVSKYARGDKIKAMAKFISEDDKGNKRFYLSVKHLDNSAWEQVSSSLPIRSVQDFEIFKIETDTGNILGSVCGVCAIIPSKEVSWVATLMSNFHIGQIIPVTIESMDNKLGFETIVVSHRNTQRNPWAEIKNTFNVGDVIQTKITKIYDGEMLFVRLLDEVDAIVYPVDVDWVDPKAAMASMAVGDEVQVKITQLNHLKKKITASIKDVITNPLDTLVSGYKTKSVIKEIAKNGTVFIDVEVGDNHFVGIIENKIIKKDKATSDALIGKTIGDVVDCVVIRLEANKVIAKCY